MAEDNLQFQRFELKYVVREETALAVRTYVQSYLELDEFGATRPNLSYPVHSLYLDSDSLTLYRHTINGNKNRYKLRLRFYENRPNAPVYFEIKRRMNDAILKQRGAVKRNSVEALLAGHLPETEQMVSTDPRQLVAVQRFRELMVGIEAKPRAHVAYYREAWISPHNNSVRVTMDRDVRIDPEGTARLEADMLHPVHVFGNRVVLELKFTGRFPDWFREMVRIFGVRQCSAAKYADGIAMVGENQLLDASRVFTSHPPLEEDQRRERRPRLADRGIA